MLTKEQQKGYEAQLIKAQKYLKGELGHHAAIIGNDGPGYSTHMADDATDVFEQEKELTLQQTLRDELELVEEALTRMGKGKFGICERCGKEVDHERLDALPHVRYCVACQTVLDERYS